MIREHLETLESTGLICRVQAEPELEYLFRHALVQEVAYGSLLKEDRRRLHLAVGQALERLYPGRKEEMAATLAHHFDAAGEENRAFPYYVLAGDLAFGRYAVPEAVEHYQRALELAPRIAGPATPPWLHLYTRLGRALELNARYESALAIYGQMEARALEQGDRAMELLALMERARIHSTPNPAHDTAQGAALAERALKLAQELGDRMAEARVHWILMLLNWLRRDRAESLAHGERSLALVRPLDQPEQLAYTLQDLHRAYRNTDRFEEARAALDESRRLWRALNNLPMLADNLNSTADLLISLGDYEQGLSFAEEAYRISQAIGNLWNQAFSRGMAAEAYMGRLQIGQAIQSFQEAIALGDQAGLVILSARTRLGLAGCYLLLGAHEEAGRILENFRAHPGPMSDHFRVSFLGEALTHRTRLEIAAGNLDAAATALQEMEGLQHSYDIYGPTVLLLRAELELARGEYGQAYATLEREKQGMSGPPGMLLRTRIAQGRSLIGMDRLDEAAVLLRQALADARERFLRYHEWQVLLILSDLEGRRGNTDAAAELLQQARPIVEQILSSTPQEELRAAFLRRPDVQAVLRTLR